MVICCFWILAQAETVITADQGVRGGKIIELKKVVDGAVKASPCVKRVFVYQRTGGDIPMSSIDFFLDKVTHPLQLLDIGQLVLLINILNLLTFLYQVPWNTYCLQDINQSIDPKINAFSKNWNLIKNICNPILPNRIHVILILLIWLSVAFLHGCLFTV